MEDSARNDLTDGEAAFLEALGTIGGSGTTREIADEMETSVFRSKRVSDDAARGYGERLEAKGEVVQVTEDGKRVYRPAG